MSDELQAVIYATEDEARAAVAAINRALGYPRTDVGTGVGGGIHVESVTTVSECEPIALIDGTFALEAARVGKALAIDAADERAVSIAAEVVAVAEAVPMMEKP